MRYLIVLLAMAGCAHRQTLTPEQQADLIVAKYGPLCEKLGYQVDTDQWRSCVLSRFDAAMQERSSRRAAAAGMYGARQRNCSFIGNQMMCN